mmetsp:Transcript_14018/g.40663  ORF Transcript_14018/g.40663 Transcript_14018/m.40663 type:complete len:290 (-) Transcript_14018:446-1315(-)
MQQLILVHIRHHGALPQPCALARVHASPMDSAGTAPMATRVRRSHGGLTWVLCMDGLLDSRRLPFRAAHSFGSVSISTPVTSRFLPQGFLENCTRSAPRSDDTSTVSWLAACASTADSVSAYSTNAVVRAAPRTSFRSWKPGVASNTDRSSSSVVLSPRFPTKSVLHGGLSPAGPPPGAAATGGAAGAVRARFTLGSSALMYMFLRAISERRTDDSSKRSCAVVSHAMRAKWPLENSAKPCACPPFQFIWDASYPGRNRSRLLSSRSLTSAGKPDTKMVRSSSVPAGWP